MIAKDKVTFINIPNKRNCSGSNISVTQNKNVCIDLYCNNSFVLSYTSCDVSFINSLSWKYYSSAKKNYSTCYDENSISISDAADGFNVYGAIIVSDLLLCGKVECYSSRTIPSTIAWSTLASAVGTLKKYSFEPFLNDSTTFSCFAIFLSDVMSSCFDKDIIKHKN